MKSAKTPKVFSLSFTDEELRVLVTALSCTDHIPSGRYQEILLIQNCLLNRFTSFLLQSGDACRHPVLSSDVVEQGGN